MLHPYPPHVRAPSVLIARAKISNQKIDNLRLRCAKRTAAEQFMTLFVAGRVFGTLCANF